MDRENLVTMRAELDHALTFVKQQEGLRLQANGATAKAAAPAAQKLG